MNDVGLKNLNNFPKLPELSIVKKYFNYIILFIVGIIK